MLDQFSGTVFEHFLLTGVTQVISLLPAVDRKQYWSHRKSADARHNSLLLQSPWYLQPVLEPWHWLRHWMAAEPGMLRESVTSELVQWLLLQL